MNTKWTVGDVVVYKGKQHVVNLVEAFNYGLHRYDILYKITEFGWVEEKDLKGVND